MKNLGFYNLKHLPRYVIKEVREKGRTYFKDKDGYKRDRQIVKRKYKYQKSIKDIKFDSKLTGRDYTKGTKAVKKRNVKRTKPTISTSTKIK